MRVVSPAFATSRVLPQILRATRGHLVLVVSQSLRWRRLVRPAGGHKSGGLVPTPCAHVLIEAISGTKDRSIALLVVGGGYDEGEYRKDVARRGLEERIIFAGPRSHSGELPHYYALGDFLVLPSTHSESFGLVVLEAMSSGIPAIVSSLPGPSQLIEDGVDGLITKAGDAEDLKEKIEYLAKEHEIRRSMGKAAREKVLKKYSWEKTGERLEAALKEVVKNQAGG